jgi:uncharacterized protein
MSLPSLRLIDIPSEGMSISCAMLPDEIALGDADAQVQDLLTVCAEMHKIGGEVVSARGSIAGTFIRQCVRCLKDYDTYVSIPFSVEYRRQEPRQEPPHPPQGTSREHDAEEALDQAGASEDDVYDFTGDHVELAAMLREHVILSTPMQPLCDADCLGLCPVCGQDRNERVCGCSEQIEESPFAPLRQLRDQVRRKVDPQRN